MFDAELRNSSRTVHTNIVQVQVKLDAFTVSYGTRYGNYDMTPRFKSFPYCTSLLSWPNTQVVTATSSH